MKLYAPAYYQKFACIANRCQHSCCIGWEIDVDEDTLAFYHELDGDYAEEIRNSIAQEDVPHFVLDAHDRCPHLDSQGLCRIIKAFGDGALCDICREHPRFYHRTPHGMEVGLGLSCEAACRLVLDSDDFDCMIELEQLCAQPDPEAFDATPLRTQIFALLRAPNLTHAQRLQRIANTFGTAPAQHSDRVWRKLLAGLEYLDHAHLEAFACYSSNPETPPTTTLLLTRALAYFVFRHCSDAESLEDFRTRLGLALFLERLLCSLIKKGADAYDAARIVSEELEYSEDNTNAIRTAFLR